MLLPGLATAGQLITKATPRLTILHTNDWHSRIEPFRTMVGGTPIWVVPYGGYG